MTLQHFSLDAIKDFDFGKINAVFQAAMRNAASDCIDRPYEKKPRAVNLEFAMVPVVESDGTCDIIKAEFRIKTALPKQVTKTYEFRVDRRGNLSYSQESPDSVDQRTLDFGKEE